MYYRPYLKSKVTMETRYPLPVSSNQRWEDWISIKYIYMIPSTLCGKLMHI